MEYEKLLNKLYDENIEVYEFPFKGKGKGYYFDNSIALNSKIIAFSTNISLQSIDLYFRHQFFTKKSNLNLFHFSTRFK